MKGLCLHWLRRRLHSSLLKNQGETDAWCGFPLERSTQLARQNIHNSETERFLATRTRGHSNSIVSHPQRDAILIIAVQLNPDFARPRTWKSVLESVVDEFIQDEAAGDSLIQLE